MTPQERQLVDELFDRLARLEAAPRDPDAERAISEGLQRAPHALYPLVQTVLVQDEALKRADARIRELSGEDEETPAQGGFLDSMRAALTGRPARTSVPSVRSGMTDGGDSRFAGAGVPGRGGSFLGTAAASAAGVIGGALLLNTIGSMFGQRGGSAQAATSSPWDQGASNSELARDAGADRIGGQPAGLYGGDRDEGIDAGSDDLGDFGGDVGGDL